MSRARSGVSVRSVRPEWRPAVEPEVPRWLAERERLASEEVVDSVTVFPVGAECPFACVYCDLWRHTLGPVATPAGSIPRQLRSALAVVGEPPGQLKIYNASNFFEDRAVPPEDDAELLELLASVPRVVVECHPRWIGERCHGFARALAGRLQVALGLETVHPEALPRLGKAMTVERFDRAVEELLRWGIGVRAFVLVGTPYVPPCESVEWAARSVEHALRRGVEHVALLPVRGGNSAIEELRRRGELRAPALGDLEDAFDRSLGLGLKGVVTVDLWDLEENLSCARCRAPRLERLERMNLSGQIEPRVECPAGCAAR